MTKRVRKVIFPVGGLGTRFLPATKVVPKEMLSVVDKPIIHYAFEEARDAGIEQFIFVTGRNKVAIDNHFDHAYELQSILEEKNKSEDLQKVVGWLPEPGNLFFTRQQGAQGLGHAVWCARHLIGDEPFAVILPDDMILSRVACLKQMLDAYNETGGNMVATQQVPLEMTKQYGIIDPLTQQKGLVMVRGLVEKPEPSQAPSNYAIIGRYVLQPEIFDVLENQGRGAGGEIQLTDAINTLSSRIPTYGYQFEGKRYDCGNRLGFIEANIAFALERDDMRERVLDILDQYRQPEAEPMRKAS